jgi:AraC-like DNA-binding protein
MPERIGRALPTELLARLHQAREYVDEHYRMALSVDQLAAMAQVSKFHFIRSFKVAYGMTPIRYLSFRRIRQAQDLLRDPDLTVTQVCMRVGFTSLGSFSSRFSQLVGQSPSAYRRSLHGDGRQTSPRT